MIRTISIGRQDYETLRMKNNFYVDKTYFIKEWWEADDEVTLLTRPRRFGKTLNMSMIEKFFSTDYIGRSDLFEGLSIWQEEEYRRLQGTYPVIFASFADVKESNFADARKKLGRIIANLYSRYDFLLEGDCLSEGEKALYCKGKNAEMDDVDTALALNQLSGYLSRYYGKKVILLLDEYDTPMQEAYVNGYWEEMSGFMRRIFHAAFKTNPYMERALMTGTTRVSKESIFSDFNNPKVVTTTSKEYADCFGFTEEEVFAALDEYDLSEKKEQVKIWYDGFTFGNKADIYNPWSIINYLDNRDVGLYWANTSSNRLAGKLIREGSKAIKQEFEHLMRGGIVKAEIDEQLVYGELSGRTVSVWSLLLSSGYLKVVKKEFSEQTGRYCYTLSLTNREVQIMFESLIHSWFTEAEDTYNDFLKALLQGDEGAMNEYMNRITKEMFSSFDTGKKPSESEPERFYHGFVLGLMTTLAERYTLTSNRESGFGRYDVLLEPKTLEDDAIILEFKVFRPQMEKSLEETAEAALAQIEEKQYASALEAKGIPADKIRSYGFAFEGKKVLIRGGKSLQKQENYALTEALS